MIHRLSLDASLPEAVSECDFYSLSKTAEEISLVCPENIVVTSEKSNPDWKCLKVAGPLDFKLTGILSGITDVLADEKISIFPIPGSSAVISAMSISGFDDQFLFYGFLPKKEKLLENIFIKLQDLDYSIVFFIPASRRCLCLGFSLFSFRFLEYL